MKYEDGLFVDFDIQANIIQHGITLEDLKETILEAIGEAIYEEDHAFGENVDEKLSLESLKIDFKENIVVAYAWLEGNHNGIRFVFRWNLN